MNILTFDIEEWAIEKRRGGNAVKYAEYDRYLDMILSTLSEQNLKATFFCVGEMGLFFPEVVRKIRENGHEIGCHSHAHNWMNKMTYKECRQDTIVAIDSLEQCLGEKVKCYRAPAFSIGDGNPWMFEILSEVGVTHDASVFPLKRDFGGFSGFGSRVPCIIDYGGTRIKEFPICTTKVFGKEVAYSGGGYFRLFPLNMIRSSMKSAEYCMCYFHIMDFLPETSGIVSKEAYEAYYKEPGTLKNRCVRFLKSNLGKQQAWGKYESLLSDTDFICIEDSDSLINWGDAKVVHLQ